MTRPGRALTVVHMFDKVLVGVDGLQGGRDAIALARRLAGGRIVLANIFDDMVELHDGWRSRAALELLTRERLTMQVQAETMIKPDYIPGRGLRRLAADQHADLLVLGSCHRGPLGRVLMGNDT